MNETVKDNKIILVGIILMLLVTFIALSFAYFTASIQEGSLFTTTGIVDSARPNDIEFTGQTALNITGAYPMTDAQGLTTDKYTFTVTSSSPRKIKYNIVLKTNSSNTLPNSLLKINLSQNSTDLVATKLLSTVQTKTNTDSTYSYSYVLYSDILEPCEESTFDLGMWIDESGTTLNAMNKTWSGKIELEASYNSSEDKDSLRPLIFDSIPQNIEYSDTVPLTVNFQNVTDNLVGETANVIIKKSDNSIVNKSYTITDNDKLSFSLTKSDYNAGNNIVTVSVPNYNLSEVSNIIVNKKALPAPQCPNEEKIITELPICTKLENFVIYDGSYAVTFYGSNSYCIETGTVGSLNAIIDLSNFVSSDPNYTLNSTVSADCALYILPVPIVPPTQPTSSKY